MPVDAYNWTANRSENRPFPLRIQVWQGELKRWHDRDKVEASVETRDSSLLWGLSSIPNRPFVRHWMFRDEGEIIYGCSK